MLCQFCKGKGWGIYAMIGSDLVPDGTLAVQKCDMCSTFDSDSTATIAARAEGIECSRTYPCVLEGKTLAAFKKEFECNPEFRAKFAELSEGEVNFTQEAINVSGQSTPSGA